MATWVARAAISPVRQFFGGVLPLLNNQLWLVGGTSTTGNNPSAVVQSFDPMTNTWTTRAALPIALRFLSVVELGGYLYAIGGRDLFGAANLIIYRYDPVTNTWAAWFTMPAGNASEGSFTLALPDGRILIAGGTISATNSIRRDLRAFVPGAAPNTGTLTTIIANDTASPLLYDDAPMWRIGTTVYIKQGRFLRRFTDASLTALVDAANIFTDTFGLYISYGVHGVVVNGALHFWGGGDLSFGVQAQTRYRIWDPAGVGSGGTDLPNPVQNGGAGYDPRTRQIISVGGAQYVGAAPVAEVWAQLPAQTMPGQVELTADGNLDPYTDLVAPEEIVAASAFEVDGEFVVVRVPNARVGLRARPMPPPPPRSGGGPLYPGGGVYPGSGLHPGESGEPADPYPGPGAYPGADVYPQSS